MSEEKKKITGAEALLLGGRLLQRLGEKMEDQETPGEINLSEWLAILQETAVDAWSEFND